MANTLEYTLSLDDRLSGKLTKIAIANDRQLATWAKVQQRVVSAEATMRQCGTSLGSLRERVAALRAEKEWIPAGEINAIRRTNAEIRSLEEKIRRLESAGDGRLKAWFGNLLAGVPAVGMLTRPLSQLETLIGKVGDLLDGSQEAWNRQAQAEMKLATVMRRRINATDEEIDSIRRLTSAQQALGVIDDQVQLAGAQQLAAFVTRKESLDVLIPAMNNLLARQKGLNATDRDAVQVGNLMGRALQGQTAALSRAGITLAAAEEKVLRYGDEQQRAATLAQVITDNVGRMNEALAHTPEGQLRQHTNTMGDLQERIGRLRSQVRASLLPLFDGLGNSLASVVSWFERNREAALTTINAIAHGIHGAFSLIGRIVGGTVGLLGGWLAKLQQSNVPVTICTALIGALAASMALFSLEAKVLAIWSGIVTAAKWAWAAAQNALNLSLLACPATWIVACIVALIGTIAYLCYKIDGWRSLWEGVVGFMKYSFMAYVDGVKLYFSTLVNGILIGLDKIKLGWYRFKEACGIGDSSENRAAIARINADIESRQQAIAAGAKKVAENVSKAKESLSGIDMSWNSGRSLGEVVAGVKNRFGIGAPAVPGMSPAESAGTEGGDETAGAGTASAIAAAGSRATSITINLRSLVEQLVFEGGYEQHRDEMERDLESALIRVLQMANSAL